MASLSDFTEEIKLKLTGDLLETELDDETIHKIIKSALRELQRYITDTKLITIPFSRCINLSEISEPDEPDRKINVSSVVTVYRTSDLANGEGSGGGTTDPMQVAQWQLLSGMGNFTNFQNAIYNYGSWTTLQQIRNTTSTDLAFRYDKASNKLYINISEGTPANITVEYIPVYTSVEDIPSEYWIDMLMRLSIALTKVTLGRIRTRYSQSNALWTGDGDIILQEGKDELNSLREMLLANSELCYPID